MSLTAADWADFKAAMLLAHDSFNQKPITWLKSVSTLNPFGEDGSSTETEIILKGLVYYNFMRTWPVTKETQSGQIDDESLIVILNKQYLESHPSSVLNADGYLAYDPGHDRFIIGGIRYEPAGDTYADQIFDDENLFFLILNRETRKTGDKVYA